MVGGKKEVRGERWFFTDSRFLGWGVDIDLRFWMLVCCCCCWKGWLREGGCGEMRCMYVRHYG